jgi:tetratricopeptide (TPR) repeat protein
MFGWCPEFFLNKTKSFIKDHPVINKKLYVSYGDLDYVQVLNYIDDFKEELTLAPENLLWKIDLIENTSHVPFATMNNALLFFFSECTMNAERKKLSVPEIKSHFEALSKEYGFTVNPKAGVLFDMVIDLRDEQKNDQAIDLNKYLISLYPDSEIYFYYLGKLYEKQGAVELAKENQSGFQAG